MLSSNAFIAVFGPSRGSRRPGAVMPAESTVLAPAPDSKSYPWTLTCAHAREGGAAPRVTFTDYAGAAVSAAATDWVRDLSDRNGKPVSTYRFESPSRVGGGLVFEAETVAAALTFINAHLHYHVARARG